mgnify:CR=1 FL=1
MYVIKKTDSRGIVEVPKKWGFSVEKIEMKKEREKEFLSAKKIFSTGQAKIKTPWKKAEVIILEYADIVEVWRKEDFEKWRNEMEKSKEFQILINELFSVK